MILTRLAEELIKTLGDADHGTALSALAIAKEIVVHREYACIEAQRQMLNDAAAD